MTRKEIMEKAVNYDGNKIAFVDGAEWMQSLMQNNFISVNDRLPNENGEYLVFTDYGSIKIAYFSVNLSIFLGESLPKCSITHWMPLPEPPKTE